MKVYQRIAQFLRMIQDKNKRNIATEFEVEQLRNILKNEFPSGSGFDAGWWISKAACNPTKIVIRTQFHRMNDNGYYCGWVNYKIIMTADLEVGYRLKVTGRDVQGIKDLVFTTIEYSLCKEINY